MSDEQQRCDIIIKILDADNNCVVYNETASRVGCVSTNLVADVGNPTNEMLCDMMWKLHSCVHGYRHDESNAANRKDRDEFMLHASRSRWCLTHLLYFHRLNPHITIPSLVEQFRLYLKHDVHKKGFEIIETYNGSQF